MCTTAKPARNTENGPWTSFHECKSHCPFGGTTWRHAITMLQNAADWIGCSNLRTECRQMNIGPTTPAIRWKSKYIVFDAIHRNSLILRKIGYTAAISISAVPTRPQYVDSWSPATTGTF